MEQEYQDKLFGRVRFGITVEEFLNSEVGKYLVSRAERERETALTALLTADPEDKRKVIELQFQGRLPDLVMKWLADAVTSGRLAERELTQDDIVESDR